MENLKENQVKVRKEILKPDRNFFHLKMKNKERKSKLNQEQPEEKKYYIKRIIGLPGEKIRIDDAGCIYINGKVLKESYGLAVMESPGIAKNEITLGKDEYFVLGDNRNNSEDSRAKEVGVVKRDSIIGKAWLKIYPFHEIGWIKHQ